jgi:hypothetical protein
VQHEQARKLIEHYILIMNRHHGIDQQEIPTGVPKFEANVLIDVTPERTNEINKGLT